MGTYKKNIITVLILIVSCIVFQTKNTEAAISYVSQFGSFGSGNGQFNTPSGITVDTQGYIYVADLLGNRVQKFDSSGQYVSQFGSAGSADGQFNSPRALATFGSYLYVVDQGNNRVQVFTTNGQHIISFGGFGTGDGQFKNPSAVALDSSGNVYIQDSNNNRVQKLSGFGNFQMKFGSQGSGNGQFLFAGGQIAVDTTGTIYVTDPNNNRIQKFNSSGVFQSSISSNRYGLALRGTDRIFTVASSGVSELDTNGNPISTFGSSGSGNGQFNNPNNMAYGANKLYVVDTGNARVQILSVPAAPTLGTTQVSSIGTVSATLGVSVDDTGGSDATQHGFAYSTSANLSTVIATTTLGAFVGTGSFSESISGLSSGTTYYVRAYVTNGVGTSYGSIVSFVTNGPSTVTTSEASSVNLTSATLNGSIDETGGEDATEHGFAYGTSADLSTVIATTTLGLYESTGSFTDSVSGLTQATIYYFRAYAINSVGTSYGTIESFTTATPINITTCAELQAMSDDLSGNYFLSNDIDCTGFDPNEDGKGFIPVGSLNDETQFTGTFDGNGHTISGLTINRPDESGMALFGNVNGGTYRDVTITGSIEGYQNVGSLIGYSGSGNLTISDITSSVSIRSHRGYTGGLVAESPVPTTITDSHYTGNIIVTDDDENDANNIGGLVGTAGEIDISESSVASNITVSSDAGGIYHVGGLVGYANATLTLADSFFNGNIHATSTLLSIEGIGGILGHNNGHPIEVTNNYAVGNITVSAGDETTYIGGLVGYTGSAESITNSFAAIAVSATSTNPTYNIGALIGDNSVSTLENNFYDKTLSTLSFCTGEDDPDPEGCTAIEDNTLYFKENNTNSPLDSWNFDTIWKTVDANYPILTSLPSPNPEPEEVPTSTQRTTSSGSRAITKGTPPNPPSPKTIEQIKILLTQLIVELNRRIANGEVVNSTPSSTLTFTRDLKLGSTGEDVRALQIYLNNHGFPVSSVGDGSRGSETSTFGPATKAALIKFQKEKKIIPAEGYFGPKTRIMINDL